MKTNSTPQSAPQPQSFLFTSWEGGGSIAPAITVARKLRERGHRVRFMSDQINRLDAESAGLEFRPWQQAPSRADRTRHSCKARDWEAESPQAGIIRYFDTIFFGPALDYARDLVAELEREPADLVVTSELLCAKIVAMGPGPENLRPASGLLRICACPGPGNREPSIAPLWAATEGRMSGSTRSFPRCSCEEFPPAR